MTASPAEPNAPRIDWKARSASGDEAPEAFSLRLQAVPREEIQAAHGTPQILPALPSTSRSHAATETTQEPASPEPAAAPPSRPAETSQQKHAGSDDDSRREANRDSTAAAAEPAAKSVRAEATAAVEAVAAPRAHQADPAAIAPSPAPPKTAASETPAPREAAPPAPVRTAPEVPDDKPAAQPAHEISLRVSSTPEQKVDIRVTDRAGEVHVSVRTSDEALARSMREDLGGLTGKLAQSGYETIAPARRDAASTSTRHGNQDGGESSGGSGQRSSHDGSGRRQQEQQQDGRQRRPAWLEEFNQSLAGGQPGRYAS